MSDYNDKNLQMILDELKNLPEIDLPDGFHDNVMNKIRDEAARQKARKRRKISGAIGGLAAAAAVVFIMAFVLDFGAGDPQYAGDFAAMPVPQMVEIPMPMAAAGEADSPGSWARFADDAEMSADAEFMTNIDAIPPAFLGFTLEEQFDNVMATRDDEPNRMAVISAVSFPDRLPTDAINFYTPDRFAISFELRVVTDDFDAAMHVAGSLAGEMDHVHSWHYGDFIRNDIVMAFEFEELEEIFVMLYDLGIVEEYRSIIVDTWLFDDAEEADMAMEAHGNVILTLISDVE